MEENNYMEAVEKILDIKADDYLKGMKKAVIAEQERTSPVNVIKNITMFRICEITYEENGPRKEALENVITSLKIPGFNFIYLILGDKNGVNFYFGVCKDEDTPYSKDETENFSVDDAGDLILGPSIKGNFRGSVIDKLSPDELKNICGKISDMKRFRIIQGIPGINKDDEDFQTVDRLVDVMLGDVFGCMIIAKPLAGAEISEIENSIYSIYSKLNIFAHSSVQQSYSSGTNESRADTDSESRSDTHSTSNSKQISHSNTDGYSDSTSVSDTSGSSKGTSESSSSSGARNQTSQSAQESTSKNHQTGRTKGTTSSETNGTTDSSSESDSSSSSTGKQTTLSSGTNKGQGQSYNIDIVNKKAQDWIKYIDNSLLPCLDYGKGKGLFTAATLIFAENNGSLIKLENTFCSLYSGESGNKSPLRAIKDPDAAMINAMMHFRIPKGKYPTDMSEDEMAMLTAQSKSRRFPVGNWVSAEQISLIAGLPQKEVVGMRLREEVDFGLNAENISTENGINLGNLVQNGTELENMPVFFDRDNFDKHIFVTGVTGSGKTTTCQKLLLEDGGPFMVIEPAKTEYRILMNKTDDLIVFTLGKDSAAPFRLNPFEFMPNESISSHVDMIKASIEAAFDMEAAIPQLIEAAIYRVYEKYGWDIYTNRNKYYPDETAFEDGVYAFPTLSDVLEAIPDMVVEQGFDDRLRDEYIGSIKARLQSLTIGSKGQMLNTKRSIDFRKLIDRKVVIEMEEIRSTSEKSLIMGFILSNLSEAVKAKYKETGKPHHHITLVEEAHRLLSKYIPGDSMNKKQSVEVFTDLLAEVRKYGESFIIVDQIPNKMTPEVLKNTNTKIVHRIFAQDDKEAIGNTMALSDEQKSFLSNLQPGRVIMFSQGWSKAIQLQVSFATDTSETAVSDEKIRKSVLDFYAAEYKSGIFPGIDMLGKPPSREFMENYLALLENRSAVRIFSRIKTGQANKEDVEKFRIIAKKIIASTDINVLAKYLAVMAYLPSDSAESITRNRIAEEIKKAVLGRIDVFTGEEISVNDYINFK